MFGNRRVWAVPLRQPGVGVGRLRRAVHPRGRHRVLVVAAGDLGHSVTGKTADRRVRAGEL